jgi:hypothetical protein
MFSVPRVNVVESDEGFSVEVLGRTGLRYTEGSKAMFIDSEVLAAPAGIAMYRSSIGHWDPPDDTGDVDEATRLRIVDNVRRAFQSQRWPLDVM